MKKIILGAVILALVIIPIAVMSGLALTASGQPGEPGQAGDTPSMQIGTPVITVDGNAVSWNSVGWALEYVLYLNGERIEEFGANITEFNLNALGLTFGTAYEIRVQALTAKPFENSELSNIISFRNRFEQISAGTEHSMALDTLGNVWTWGNNSFGRLGRDTGANTYDATPRQIENVTGFENIVEISAGNQHSMALDADGNIWTWGIGFTHALGHGTSVNELFPRMVENGFGVAELPRFDSISASGKSMALDADGYVWTWGQGFFGQLGHGVQMAQETMPRRIVYSGFENIVQIQTAYQHSMALDYYGNVWTWGSNANGNLGHGASNIHVLSPKMITGVTGFDGNVMEIFASNTHLMALDSNGNVWGWGRNFEGQLGLGFSTPLDPNSFIEHTPAKIQDLEFTVRALTAGGFHSVAVDTDGNVWSWGRTDQGAVTVSVLDPEQVVGLSQFFTNLVAVSGGAHHTMALDANGNIWTWGAVGYGRLGHTGNHLSPHLINMPFIAA